VGDTPPWYTPQWPLVPPPVPFFEVGVQEQTPPFLSTVHFSPKRFCEYPIFWRHPILFNLCPEDTGTVSFQFSPPLTPGLAFFRFRSPRGRYFLPFPQKKYLALIGSFAFGTRLPTLLEVRGAFFFFFSRLLDWSDFLSGGVAGPQFV